MPLRCKVISNLFLFRDQGETDALKSNLEADVNKWLRGNPDVIVRHVVPVPGHEPGDLRNYGIMIFYEK